MRGLRRFAQPAAEAVFPAEGGHTAVRQGDDVGNKIANRPVLRHFLSARMGAGKEEFNVFAATKHRHETLAHSSHSSEPQIMIMTAY